MHQLMKPCGLISTRVRSTDIAEVATEFKHDTFIS